LIISSLPLTADRKSIETVWHDLPVDHVRSRHAIFVSAFIQARDSPIERFSTRMRAHERSTSCSCTASRRPNETSRRREKWSFLDAIFDARFLAAIFLRPTTTRGSQRQTCPILDAIFLFLRPNRS
jgi:hypothetical protein